VAPASQGNAGTKEGAALWRMVTVCDNKSVNFFDFEGKQVPILFAVRLVFRTCWSRYWLGVRGDVMVPVPYFTVTRHRSALSFTAPLADSFTAPFLCMCASPNQTASVDLSPLGSGRPRDLTSCSPHAAAVTDPDMRAVVQTETECLVIATSQGQVLVLSANRLEQLGLQVRRAPCGVLRYHTYFSVSLMYLITMRMMLQVAHAAFSCPSVGWKYSNVSLLR
jgi:hypothetical protein